MDLLEKASIILTPTASNNGEALCVKPSDGSGDFDFSRNSAATRVNAQGLVENVQILSSNLVQNGSFSEEGAEEVSNGSFSQEGAELITNGDFSSDTAWGKEVGWSISDGSLVANSVTTGLAFQSNIVEANKFYKATYDVVVTSGSIGLYFDGGTGYQGIATTTQTVTVFFKATTASPLYFRSDTSNFTGSIDNVSVREVAQDWSLGTGWSIGEDKAISDGTSSNLDQFNTFTSGTTYKVVYTIEDYISGDIRFRFTGASNENGTLRNSNGTYTEYIKLTNTQSVFRFIGSGVLSITNISVKEVGQNWVLGDWSVGDSLVLSGNTSSLLQQPSIYTNATGIYKTTFKAKSVNGTSVTLRVYDGSGSYETFTITSSDFQDFTFTRQRVGTDATLSIYNNSGAEIDITNISVIEITTDTSLPRINYEGFSYQDVLGSELVVNGDFATDSNWNKDANWSIANGVATSTGFGRMFQSIPFLETNVGTKVKVSFDITEKTNGGVVVNCYGGVSQLFTSVGTHTFVTTTINSTNLYFNNIGAGGGFIGSIDNVSVKEYLGQEVVPDSGCGSWLWEPQTTQLVPYSEDFSQSFWTKQASVTLDKGYLAPDGTYNATKISGVIGSSYVVSQGGILSSSSTKSIWAKTTSGTGVIHLGANQNQSNASFTVTNEWQRFEVTGTTTDVYAVDFRNASTTLSEVLVWGAQGENLSYATSYIPTNGEANGVTRNQDVCSNGGSLASINSTEGVLYAEIAKRQDNNDSYILISLNNQASNSDNNSVTIGFSNSTGFFLRIRASGNSYLLFQGSSVLANKNQFYKVALKYKSGNSSVFIDGVNVLNSTDIFSFNQSLDNLSFDFNGNGGYPFYGKTKAVAVWKEALSDSELQSLTTI